MVRDSQSLKRDALVMWTSVITSDESNISGPIHRQQRHVGEYRSDTFIGEIPNGVTPVWREIYYFFYFFK